MIIIKTFAQIREISGHPEFSAPWQPNMTVESLMTHLTQQDNAWAEALSENVLIAVNQAICSPEQGLSDNDEVAFFPPVTGG